MGKLAKSEGRTIPYGRQDITDADIESVVSVLRSEFLTQGPVVPQFERSIAQKVGARYAVASNSGTSSLHLACLALGVAPGDFVWTTPITFVATANCARYCGAAVDFVDIDPRSYNICVDRLSEKLTDAARTGRLPKVVIPVHLAGHSAEMAEIWKLSEKYGFFVVEDASHAIGGSYRGGPIGNCQYSNVAVFSFHPVKIITCGEGGMAVTNDVKVSRSMARLRSHGITRDPAEMTTVSEGLWYYQQQELGYNYRMTDILAALGLSQSERLDSYVSRRQALAARYDELLNDLPVVTPWRDHGNQSGFHLYIVRLRLNEISVTRREVFERMRTAGVLVNVHYIPLYHHQDFSHYQFSSKNFPNAEAYYAEALTLPLYPGLSEADQDYVVERLRQALGK